MASLRRRRGERGAAAVEFALIATIMVTLMVGIIQFAIWFWGYQSGAAAAREAARFAAASPCDNAAISARGVLRVDETAPTGNGTANVTVTSAKPTRVGDDITVRVQFDTVTLAPGLIPGFSNTIVKQATARVENIPAGGCR